MIKPARELAVGDKTGGGTVILWRAVDPDADGEIETFVQYADFGCGFHYWRADNPTTVEPDAASPDQIAVINALRPAATADEARYYYRSIA